jgi:hypothetical protein
MFLHRLLLRLREAHAAQVELRQRVWLLNQPWLEDLMHWSYDDGRWVLHGQVLPRDARVRSLTRDGWCPGVRARSGDRPTWSGIEKRRAPWQT